MLSIAQHSLEELQQDNLTPFNYLKKANQYLSSPAHEKLGREFIIRALDKKHLFLKHDNLFKNLVRKSGLYPYLQKHFTYKSDEINLLLDLYKSHTGSSFILHSMQAKVLNLLMNNHNVILSAPTSMGKSIIIDSLMSANKHSRIVIVVPTIALIDETRRRITEKFNQDYQVIYHNSQKTKKDKVIYILTQERVNERNDILNIDLFIIDEFYKLAFTTDDMSRVISLNIALSKLLTVSKQFYMIGPHIDSVRGVDAITKEYIFIPTDFNTVAQNIYEFNIKPKSHSEKNEKLKEILCSYSGQSIVYCQSPNSTYRVAEFLKTIDIVTDIESESNYVNWVVENYGYDWIYTQALQRGVGIHHGVLPRAIQQKTIDLFNKGKIRTLLCTSTIIEGVNTTAQNVIIYDNRRSNSPIDKFTHNNIAGRAGRMNTHLVGNVFCLEAIPKDTVESRVVNVALGLQETNSPMSLLAGMQTEHISEKVSENFNNFIRDFKLPIEIIRNNPTYKTEVLTAALEFIETLSRNQLITLKTQNQTDKLTIKIMVHFFKLVENSALSSLNLHFDDSDELKVRFSKYIFSTTHQQYMFDQLNYIYGYHSDSQTRSEKTEKELKIIRNIFKHALPRALNLLQDIANFRLNELEMEANVDFGYLMHILENSHLPAAFSAIEETGVPIQTLEKIFSSKLDKVSIEVLTRYIQMFKDKIPELDSVDHSFIERALS